MQGNRLRAVATAGLAVTLLLGACSDTGAPDGLTVVATTTIIGDVVEGMDVVERISQVSTLRNRNPRRLVFIQEIRLVPEGGEVGD